VNDKQLNANTESAAVRISTLSWTNS
jgi:hypothetical protein